MKCSLCEKAPEIACNCSMPMPLLCGSDFANHIKESKGPHNQMPLEGIRDWNLFFSVKKYLLKLNEEINLKAKK